MILVQSNYFINYFLWSMATSLGLLDQLRIPPSFSDEVDNIKHVAGRAIPSLNFG
jgi:hypothetical protein